MSKYKHDWRQMLNEYEHPEHDQIEMFDRIDMRRRYETGWWVGAMTGICLTIGLLTLVGLYLNGWQLP